MLTVVLPALAGNSFEMGSSQTLADQAEFTKWDCRMTYTTDSPLTKTSGHATAQQLYAAFETMTPNAQKERVRRALDRIAVLSKELHLDEIVAAAICWVETGEANTGLPWRSRWWLERMNLGNLGVTGDPKQNEASQSWQTPEDAANALMAHLTAYAYGSAWRSVWDAGDLGLPRTWDTRFYLAIDNTPNSAGVKTIGDLNRRWAVDRDDDYGGKLAQRANAIVGAINDPPVTTPSTPEEPIPGEGVPMATPQRLDYSSLPFPVEVKFIPVGQTNQRTGIPMTPAWTTWHDTGNPGVGARADMHHAWMLNGCRGANGLPTKTSWHFTVDDKKAIQHIPLNEVAWHAGDGSGPGNYTSIGIEECVNSDRNAAKTRENAAMLHALLIRELGLKGGKIDALTQHNKWSGKNCPATIRNAGLWPQVTAMVRGFIGTVPTIPPDAVYVDAHPVAKGSRIINEHIFFAPGGKTVQVDVYPFEWGDATAAPTGPKIVKGTKIAQDQISHYVQGTDGNLWVVVTGLAGVKDGSRVPANALVADAA